MPQTIHTVVYLFHELSNKAKDKARQWWREVGTDNDWWEQVYEDAEQVGIKIIGFDIGRGQCIDTQIHDADNTAALILENHGEGCDTYQAARKYWDAVKAANDADQEDICDVLADLRSDFIGEVERCYLKFLHEQYEYEMSDENIAENIEAQGYTFTADGKRFG